jgi:Na+-transporting NADH:ubiquinone oxidoreductase subunit NqrD
MLTASAVIGIEIVLSIAKSAILLMTLGSFVGVGLALTRSVWSAPAVLALAPAVVAITGSKLADVLDALIRDRAISSSLRMIADLASAPTFVGRVDQMREAFAVMAQNPGGIGLASTGGFVVFGEAVRARLVGNTLETYYGRIAVELGVPGILSIGLVLTLCIAMAVLMFRRARQSESRCSACFFLLVAGAGTMSGIGWEVLGIKESAILFWLVMGWMRSEWAR